MPLCTCGHEDHEHDGFDGERVAPCYREGCECHEYTARPLVTSSFADLPVSQGARDLFAKFDSLDDHVMVALDILAAADEKDVRNLLWARRMGKL